MSTPDIELIDEIRTASRQMVREFGFMETTLAASDYPPSAVHSILEIGQRGAMTAIQLAEVLQLEKSSVSRMVRKLIEAGELRETTDPEDARSKLLSLTAKGRRTRDALQAYARRQVSGALSHLSEAERHVVCNGLMLYARALQADRQASVRPLGSVA